LEASYSRAIGKGFYLLIIVIKARVFKSEAKADMSVQRFLLE
jgi:hypothetical protein